jgi:hypothetical protein
MKILRIIDSPLKTKRFRIYLDNNNEHYDFGVKDKHETYIDHHDKTRRERYRLRHYNSEKEQPYIKNLIASSALFSYYILWGNSTSIQTNINYLNKLLKTKYKK